MKQVIGAANIFPLSSFFKKEHPEFNHDGDNLYKTPKGGLILHWISTVVMTAAIAWVGNIVDMVTFPGILETYGHSLIVGKIDACVEHPMS